MRGSVLRSMTLGSLFLVACSAGVQEETTAETEQSIVRATALGGKRQVVLLYMQTVVNGQLGTRSCSGSYFAPRVVLTAAHCLQNIWGTQLFAYHGTNFAADLATLAKVGDSYVAPAAGSASPFAQADSFETHPDYDAELNYPDLGIVYLDRKLPMEPIDVARFEVGRSYIGDRATLDGWGASLALTPDISQVVGARVHRTGKAKILGSPTEADFHEDDPNFGLLFDNVRRDVLKTDGHAPNSNTCAGDSGGPLLVRNHGQDYVAGVSYWTGLSCEDYSLFLRTEPFLRFIDKSERRGGGAPVKAHLNCVAENADGTLSAYFGYENENGASITIPAGPRNWLPLDTGGRRTTKFLPGQHEFVFGVDFAQNQQLFYRIDPEHGPSTFLHVNKHSARCGEAEAPIVACGGFCRAGFNAGCSDALPSYTQCLSDCLSALDFFPQCAGEYTAMNECYAATAAGPEHWLCAGDGFMPMSMDCPEQEGAFFSCLSGG
jgi:hypothetical protein